MLPVDAGIVKDALRNLEMRRIFQRDLVDGVAVEFEDLRAGESQENRRMRCDYKLRLTGCYERRHLSQKRQLALWGERRLRFIEQE